MKNEFTVYERLKMIKEPTLIYVYKRNWLFKIRKLYPSGHCEYVFNHQGVESKEDLLSQLDNPLHNIDSCFNGGSLFATVEGMQDYDEDNWQPVNVYLEPLEESHETTNKQA